MPRKIIILFSGIILGAFAFLVYQTKNVTAPIRTVQKLSNISPSASQDKTNVPRETVITENLDTPWAVAFLPDGSLLVTERSGKIHLLKTNGETESIEFTPAQSIKEIGEGGLLGIVLHPDFSNNHYAYIYYTYNGENNNTLNRVSRFTLNNPKMTDEKIVVDRIPGASNHNGGRIKFGLDKNLYITTGDAQNPSQAQDTNSLAGKILRVTDEGKSVSGNPFWNLVYSYGHRNPQGITWSESGILYETEHGPSGGQFGTGRDEFNYIESGRNYGWPIILGDQARPGMESPLFNSGRDTWAPAGAAYYRYPDFRSAVFFGGLRGEALYEIEFTGDNRKLRTHFKGQFGRIREVILGPDGMLYITTSNKDGRGNPRSGDDKLIRINPQKL